MCENELSLMYVDKEAKGTGSSLKTKKAGQPRFCPGCPCFRSFIYVHYFGSAVQRSNVPACVSPEPKPNSAKRWPG